MEKAIPDWGDGIESKPEIYIVPEYDCGIAITLDGDLSGYSSDRIIIDFQNPNGWVINVQDDYVRAWSKEIFVSHLPLRKKRCKKKK